eukprot:PhM_4_TR7921/c0_g1_i1/m.41317
MSMRPLDEEEHNDHTEEMHNAPINSGAPRSPTTSCVSSKSSSSGEPWSPRAPFYGLRDHIQSRRGRLVVLGVIILIILTVFLVVMFHKGGVSADRHAPTPVPSHPSPTSLF